MFLSLHPYIEDENDTSFVSEWDLRMNAPIFGGAPLSTDGDMTCRGDTTAPRRAIGAECGAPLQLHFDERKLVVMGTQARRRRLNTSG